MGQNYVSLADISYLDPCLFPKNSDGNRINPITNIKCSTKEGFSNDDTISVSSTNNIFDLIMDDIKEDYVAQIFLIFGSLFSLYIVYKTIKKSKR